MKFPWNLNYNGKIVREMGLSSLLYYYIQNIAARPNKWNIHLWFCQQDVNPCWIYLRKHKYICIFHHTQKQHLKGSTNHYSDIIMSTMASQITSVLIVSSTICSGTDPRKKLHITGLCDGNSPVTCEFSSQREVTQKMFPFDDVIMIWKFSPYSHKEQYILHDQMHNISNYN